MRGKLADIVHSIRHRRLTVSNVLVPLELLVKYGAQEFERWYFGTKRPGGGRAIACGRCDQFLVVVKSGGSAINNHDIGFAGTVGVVLLFGVGEQHPHEVLHLQLGRVGVFMRCHEQQVISPQLSTRPLSAHMKAVGLVRGGLGFGN